MFSRFYAIWALAWPLMLSNISVPLLGLIDTAILGHLNSPHYLAAVALGASLITFLFSSLNFLRMGTTGLSAQQFLQQQQSQKILQQGMLLALLLAGLILLLSPVIPDIGLTLMQAPDDLYSTTASYLQIRLWGAPAVLVTYVIIGWSIGQQNSRIALICLTVSCAANILLDWLLIMVLQLNSDGAAMATVIAEYLGLGIGLLLLKRSFPWLQLNNCEFNTLFSGMNRLLKLNRDLFIRSLCLLFVFAFFHAQGAQLGETVLAANAILMQLVLFQSYLLDGFANATEALVGKSVGNKRRDYSALIRATGTCSFVTACLLCIIYLLLQPWLLSWFTDQTDVINTASTQLSWVIALPLISVWGYWLDGVAVGLTASRAMRNCLLVSTWGVFIPCWWLLQEQGNSGLWIAFVVFSISRAVMLLPLLRPSAAESV